MPGAGIDLARGIAMGGGRAGDALRNGAGEGDRRRAADLGDRHRAGLGGRLADALDLVAQAMLVRRGIPATVHLGMGKPEGHFEAHAWTETSAGVVIGGERQADVQPLHSWTRSP